MTANKALGFVMEPIPLYLFKDSFGPVVALLNEHSVKYQMRQVRANVPMAAGEVIELLQSPAFLPSIAAVIIAFLKVRSSRKVIITMKDKVIVHAEGLSQKELEKVLRKAKNLSAIETKNDET